MPTLDKPTAATLRLPPETPQTHIERSRPVQDGRIWPLARDAMRDARAITERLAEDIARLAADESSSVERWQLVLAGWPEAAVVAHAPAAGALLRERRRQRDAKADARILAAYAVATAAFGLYLALVFAQRIGA